MPNIEIHGLPEGDAKTMSSQVERLLRTSPVAETAVIDRYDDVVTDLKGYPKPFFRILCIDETEEKLVVGLLTPLNLEFEMLPLRAFIPHG